MIVFFDSDCLLCQGSLKWLNRLDEHDRLRFASIGSEVARGWGISLEDDDSMAVVTGGQIYRASDAVMWVFAEVGGIGSGVALLLKVTPRPLREWGYAVIAANRKKLWKKAQCGIPEEGLRRKMVDEN